MKNNPEEAVSSTSQSEDFPSNSDEKRMALWEHLDELRKRMIYSLLSVGVAFCVTYNYAEPLLRFLERPLLDILPEGQKHLYFTGITDKFMIYLKVSALSAVVICAPVILYHLWCFISPALYPKERKLALPFILSGVVTFFLGLTFAYELVIPYGYRFLLEFGGSTDVAMITLSEYFSLTFQLMLIMGLVFELPVIVMVLSFLEIVTPEFLVRYRAHAFLGLSVLAAILTPTPDAFTLALVMVPLWVLYECSVWASRWVIRAKNR